ncbi:hypothetical protein [Singulisphaera acidiphila]|uniref:Uncharacterized protein n=1 Tax=Singulisphaera acidiphila (strain ATCC BAA-1392 / DSM 18658 / VKM B-2454 / MOB10) TaxID=886293 RepID=L0DEI9_SINAD|nr:hypothetical protein [Singulisphaera acidiphila]AGA27238.1 hypothetical protein Sinac_2954 [Singulisphaera acidiphila DSM 18658]
MSKRVLLLFSLVILVAISGQAPSEQPKSNQLGQPAPIGLQSPKELAKARLELARQAFAVMKLNQERGVARGDHDLWSLRLMEEERNASGNKAERIAAVQAHLDRVKKWEAETARLFKGGEVDLMLYMDTQWKRLEAESLLAKEKEEPQGSL